MTRLPALVLLCTMAVAGCTSQEPQTAVPQVETSAAATPGNSAVTEPTITATVAQDLKAPWSVLPLSETSALISQRDTAEILLVRDGQTSVAGTVPQTLPGGEGGLLGLAMKSPDDDKVFVYYTAATDNRVAVFDFDGTTLSNEQPVLGGIPKGTIHNGGRIAFGPDGYLYVATGEIGQPDMAQDPQALGGKILRITTDGSPAPGNPDPQSPVWSLGHRNVQGLAWDSQDQLWATEFGQNDVDELNLIEPGKNYGWPQCEGACDIPGMTNPKASWSPTATASPSGLAIVDDVAWVAALRGEALYEVRLDGDKASEPTAWLQKDLGRVRDVVAGPQGELWVLSNNTDGRGQPGAGDDRLVAVAIP